VDVDRLFFEWHDANVRIVLLICIMTASALPTITGQRKSVQTWLPFPKDFWLRFKTVQGNPDFSGGKNRWTLDETLYRKKLKEGAVYRFRFTMDYEKLQFEIKRDKKISLILLHTTREREKLISRGIDLVGGHHSNTISLTQHNDEVIDDPEIVLNVLLSFAQLHKEANYLCDEGWPVEANGHIPELKRDYESRFWFIHGTESSDNKESLIWHTYGRKKDMSNVLKAMMYARQDLQKWTVRYNSSPWHETIESMHEWPLWEEYHQHSHHPNWDDVPPGI
jgi:hypothetical protein